MRWFGWMRRRSAGDTRSALSALSAGSAMVAGRRRTRGIPYQMPLDLEEMNRLDFQHYMLRALLRGNYVAPIYHPRSILDVGTGTGRWARELAHEFPQANVIGLDVNAPIEDDRLGRRGELPPANYTFVNGNVLEGLPFADANFDFVHMRALVTAVPHQRWPAVIGELARVTANGGWIESLEVTPLEHGGPAVEQLMVWLTAVMAARGVEFADGGRVAGHMHEAGLAHVTLHRLEVLCGDSGGRIGKMLAVDWFSVLEALMGMAVARGIAPAAEVSQAMAGARVELASHSMRCVMPTYIAFGQRAG